MKMLLLTVTSIIASLSAFAQGTSTFNNDASTLVTTNDLLGHVGPAVSDTGTRVVLYYSTAAIAPSFISFSSGWTLSSPSTPDIVGPPDGAPLAGRFAGGTQTLDNAAGGSTVWQSSPVGRVDTTTGPQPRRLF